MKMLTKVVFNLAKIVTRSLEVYESLECDVIFAEHFSEMEVIITLGIQ